MPEPGEMVAPRTPLTSKVACEEWEFEAIHRLNYSTFAEEIPQHPTNVERRLVDRFHHENTYFVCLDGQRLVGMVAARGNRPFSLDQKLPELDSYLPPGRKVLEIRLLAVEQEYRSGAVLVGLFRLLFRHIRASGYDLGIISGTTRQSDLYRRLGFVPFGPLVGSGDAGFQPMYLTLEGFQGLSRDLVSEVPPIRLMPGPVTVADEVRVVLAEEPVSHRAESFLENFRRTRERLCRLTNARSAEILLGTGSLANDVIAGQLSLEQGRGLILSNGEFGERLVDHAARFRLAFDVVRLDWGDAFGERALQGAARAAHGLTWLWAVHCETSTGVLNDLDLLKRICDDAGAKLCLDCVSSIGTVPTDLSDVYLASSVSGKGLGAFPGLAIVFYNHAVKPAPDRLPRYLDLGLYAAHGGVPFTHSSNLVAALRVAVEHVDWRARFHELGELSAWLRARLEAIGAQPVAPRGHASPAVITLALPSGLRSEAVGRQLEQTGYLLAYRSAYLLARNWIQICTMGAVSRGDLDGLLAALSEQALASDRGPRSGPGDTAGA